MNNELTQLAADAVLDKRTELLRGLHGAGITSVFAQYDGQGDDGQINDVSFKAGEIDAAPVLEDAVTDMFYDLLSELYGSWGDNLGSAGTITWDIVKDTILFEHGWRVESYQEDNALIPPGPEPDKDVA